MSGAVLAVAGLDPSGRAGLLADVEAIRALGAPARAVASMLTAQGEQTFAASPVPPRALRAQLKASLERPPAAVKLGAIPGKAQLGVVRALLEPTAAPWVIDPVVTTSRGERLSSLRPADFRSLATARAVITPNLPELAWLLGLPRVPKSYVPLEDMAARLADWGWGGVVVKGGHLPGTPVDLVVTQGQAARLPQPRRRRRSRLHRGTGCRFASSLAVRLAQGATLLEAARDAQAFVRAYLNRRILE